ncbi:hypothetical protein MTR67_033038 [Solanum verrucosum]|uniref:Rab3-GAP regulatory subunit N-terminal domain-containing protein n=1 Tax=Solanum verrucosum TaxID=315347 RepID=A0AAF0U5C2_SOLVR|nr:hypothetical protein MTR67_033038 [Solanum verrucosum]
MARRNHTTELGCIACDDLSELGAGKEGWLVNNPNLLTALDTHSIALANRSLVLILHWSEGSDPVGNRVKIVPDLSPIEAEYISAIEWLVFDDIKVLALGTSRGYLLIYSLRGDLIHKQIVSPGKILRLRVRDTKRDLTQDASSEEVCVVMSGVIARFDGSDIQNMLQRWFRERHSQFWDERESENSTDTFGRLPYQLWNVSKYGSCVDAAITGLMPPPLLELQSSQRYYCAITVGADAVISAYRLSVDRSRSIVGAILSKVVPATFSTITSISKMLWRSDPSPTKRPEPMPQPFARASPLTCFKDHPRKGEKLTLSPSGTLAAITDSLGRILLLDTQALVVVRLWKGYRDASCLFVEMLAKKDIETSRSAYHEHVKSDYCLCLAIHAPRKGIVEVNWISEDASEIILVLTLEFIIADMADEDWSASSNYSMCQRSCTAEPRPNGVIWTVKKDITRYSSLLMTNQTLAVYIGNIVDSKYTGVYHVEIFVHFYPTEKVRNPFKGFDSGADLIVPISRNLPLNDGLWFEIENSTDVQSKEFKIPQNVYRAVLEIYVSFHENDEFWYGNLPNDYITANNCSDIAGNGAFREVIVSLDDVVVGAVWPFTVIYTGGINPLLWRPISGIGSFDLPSYDIEITPLLGKILDGSSHNISFSVTNALNVWYVDANLHLWLDKKSVKTEGKLLEYSSLPLSFSLTSNFTGLDGSFVTNARRSISMTGWVKSSYGTVTTRSFQSLSYSNYMVMGNDANLQVVDQTIEFNDTVYAKTRYFSVQVLESLKKFQLHMYSDGVEIGDKSYAAISNVTLIFDEKRLKYGSSASSVHNLQNAQGYMLVKDQSLDSGLGSTQQIYKYNDDKGCYFRNINSSNHTVLYDKVINSCSKLINTVS